MEMSDDHGGMTMTMTPPSMPKGDLSNTTDDAMKMIMSTNLYWGKHVIILFSGWPGHNLGMYVLALFFVFILAVAVEVLSVGPTVKPDTNPLVSGLTQSVVYTFRTGFAYLVMLSVMSFNIGILIAAVVGHAFGFSIVKARARAMAQQPTPAHPSPKV